MLLRCNVVLIPWGNTFWKWFLQLVEFPCWNPNAYEHMKDAVLSIPSGPQGGFPQDFQTPFLSEYLLPTWGTSVLSRAWTGMLPQSNFWVMSSLSFRLILPSWYIMVVDAAHRNVAFLFFNCFIISQTHRRSNLEMLLEIVKVNVDPEFYWDVNQGPVVKGLA